MRIWNWMQDEAYSVAARNTSIDFLQRELGMDGSKSSLSVPLAHSIDSLA